MKRLVIIIATALFCVFFVACDGHFVFVKDTPKDVEAELVKQYPIHDTGNGLQYEFMGDSTDNVNVVVELYARHGYKIVSAVPYSHSGRTYIIFEKIPLSDEQHVSEGDIK